MSELEKKMTLMSVQISTLMLKKEAAATSRQQLTDTVTKRDTTKYRFDGQIYCKRRIAYVCVKKYIEDNHITKYEDVLEIFPDYIQGSLGVIKPAGIAEQYSSSNRRFYFSDDDIIYFSGQPYVVCAQWEKKNISRILNIAKGLGYDIETINPN